MLLPCLKTILWFPKASMIRSKFISRIYKVLHNLIVASFSVSPTNASQSSSQSSVFYTYYSLSKALPGNCLLTRSKCPWPWPLSHSSNYSKSCSPGCSVPLRMTNHTMTLCKDFYYRTHHLIIMLLIFTFSLLNWALLETESTSVFVLFILCMRHRAWNVGGPQSLCKG